MRCGLRLCVYDRVCLRVRARVYTRVFVRVCSRSWEASLRANNRNALQCHAVMILPPPPPPSGARLHRRNRRCALVPQALPRNTIIVSEGANTMDIGPVCVCVCVCVCACDCVGVCVCVCPMTRVRTRQFICVLVSDVRICVPCVSMRRATVHVCAYVCVCVHPTHNLMETRMV